MTLKKYKDRVMDSFKVNAGNVRIVLASSALGMGVNFPDVRYVVHLGPARSIAPSVSRVAIRVSRVLLDGLQKKERLLVV